MMSRNKSGVVATTLRLRVNPTFEGIEKIRSGIRIANARNIKRSELLTGILNGVLRSGIDFSRCVDSASVSDRIIEAMRKEA